MHQGCSSTQETRGCKEVAGMIFPQPSAVQAEESWEHCFFRGCASGNHRPFTGQEQGPRPALTCKQRLSCSCVILTIQGPDVVEETQRAWQVARCAWSGPRQAVLSQQPAPAARLPHAGDTGLAPHRAPHEILQGLNLVLYQSAAFR